MVYIQYEFYTTDEAKRDFIISLLSEFGFEGFEELEGSVKGFIPAPVWHHEAVVDILSQNELGDIACQYTTIDPQNWNEVWEKNFSPVLIARAVSIRAPFHKPQPAAHELIIEPKMSFGTGHHATTALMIEQMLAMDMRGWAVVDFGCGTGILAILAAKLGAGTILAIDHEEWAVENSKENIVRNGTPGIQVMFADSMDRSGAKFDVMLANINRNVIMNNLQSWRNFLRPVGFLLVSGILEADMQDVSDMAIRSGFSKEKLLTANGWASILFKSN